MIKGKDKVARHLAERHSQVEESIVKVVRLNSKEENAIAEPIKLLEINLDAISMGIMPVFFGTSKDIPYATVVVEVTKDEYTDIMSGRLKLPDDWQIGDTLIEKER